MRYSEEIIEQIVSGNDIVGIIGESVRLKRSGSRYIGLCPFHNEKTPSFSVNGSKQMFYCFGCHAGGNVITFLMKYHNYTFVEALKYLAERIGVTLPEEQLTAEQRAESEKRARLLEILKESASVYHYKLTGAAGKTGLDYLRDRGLTDAVIRHFGLGYADQFGNSLYRHFKNKNIADDLLKDTGLFRFDEKKGAYDLFWNRVMFPIMDERGRVIGFGGRVMGDAKPKYLNSPENTLFNKRRHLFALNFARASRENYMILCEGYMDVITMHQAGYTNAVASLGTALTPEQCSLLRRFTGEILLMYDSDNAGQNAARRAIPLLKEAGLESRVVNLAPHKDPDEFIRAEGAEALKERLDHAEPAFMFEIGRLSMNYRRSDPAEWSGFQRETAAKLAAIPEELERENYLTAVCGRYGIPADGMRKLVGKQAAIGTPSEYYTPPKSGKNTGSKKEDAELRTQKFMLTYLAGYPEAYAVTKQLINAADFTHPICRKAAEALYKQLETGKVSEAALVSLFTDAEEQSFAASLFSTEIPVRNQAELDRAFTDTVRHLLKNGSDAALQSSLGDLEALSKYIERRKLLEQLERGILLHITWRGEKDG